MLKNQITWESFKLYKIDERGIRYKFEDLCRQLFIYEFLPKKKEHKFLHCNPNNTGIESEPVFCEENNKLIGFQAKYFDERTDYKQIEKSAKETIKHYKGKLNCVYLYCNKDVSTSCKSYKAIEEMLKEAGIILVPITNTTILDLVRKYPMLATCYFNDHHITHNWLITQADITKSVLGTRYNSAFNVNTEISKNLSIFVENKEAITYFNDKKKNAVLKIQSLRWKLGEWYHYALDLLKYIERIPDVDYLSIHDAEKWDEELKQEFSADIDNIKKVISNSLQLITEEKQSDPYDFRKSSIQKGEELLELYDSLVISDLEKQLLNSKLLIVEGEAGMGKTQLLADTAFSLLNHNGNALLIAGGIFLSAENVLQQLETSLRLDFTVEELIDILECIGEKNAQIVPIFIDALNESRNPEIWQSALPTLHRKVLSMKHVRLVFSLRSDYKGMVLPDKFGETNGVTIIEHNGFRGNSEEAINCFFSHYGIPFSPLYLFDRKWENPLFLTLFCQNSISGQDELPDLYDKLLETANTRICKNMPCISQLGYSSSYNLVLDVVNAISEKMLSAGKRVFEMAEIEQLPIWTTLGVSSKPFIIQLLHENILYEYTLEGKKYLRFCYDQMNDYYPAKIIVSRYSNEDELRDYICFELLGITDGKMQNYGKESLFINVCALYAEKYHKECIDILKKIEDKEECKYIFNLFIESLGWRKQIYLSISELKKYCNDYEIEPYVFWDAFITNAVKPSHLLNADALHNILMQYSLATRDYLWTLFINELDNNHRIIQLIEDYTKGKFLNVDNKEQIRLMLILFAWLLTSSNKWIRNTASKAMIEILKDNFEFSEYLLKIFAEVNDPYVIQRLYGIVFGACTKTSDMDVSTFKSLTEYVYHEIFDKELVVPDILLRDYARLIIDFFVYEFPDVQLSFDLNKIKPPYNSVPILEMENFDFKVDGNDRGKREILSSMCMDGMGGYGDFGRYVFQNAINKFNVNETYVYNYAMYYIENELHYDESLFGEYDWTVARPVYMRQSRSKIERIGKKYQWITLYTILARIADNNELNSLYWPEGILKFDGPGDIDIRDFDPTLNENSRFDTGAPVFNEIKRHLNDFKKECEMVFTNSGFDETQWIESESGFFNYHKKDLILKASSGEEWVTLSGYFKITPDDLADRRFSVWSKFSGYFVTEEQLSELLECVNEKIDMGNVPNLQSYTIYNREYPWSSSGKAASDYQYVDFSITVGEKTENTANDEAAIYSEYTRLLSTYTSDVSEEENVATSAGTLKKHEIKTPVEISIGKIVNATQKLFWEGEFFEAKQESLSSSHPCAELINKLGLRQKKYDGYYYDKENNLIAFDTDLTGQQAGLVIRKSALDVFLRDTKYCFVWFVKASNNIYGKNGYITKYSDWSGLLVYKEDSVDGNCYKVK